MKDLTESVFASDNEEEAAAVRDCLISNNIQCTLNINTNNQLFGKGILNSGEIISGGCFEIMINEKDIDNALQILSENEEKTISKEINTKEENPVYSEAELEMIDKRYFVRAMLLGFIHFLGFGTIAALISAWNISSSKKKMRFFAFSVPLCWYILVIFNLAVLHPVLTVILICINIIVLILYILSPKRPAVYLSIFVSGLIVFTAAMYYLI